MSWWRRNRIALPAMVLALGALAWPLSEPARDIWWSRQPHVAAEPDGEGWASIDGRRVRIVTFDEVREFPDDDEAPEGLTVWRAELTSEATGSGATESLACEAQLADADGTTYSAGPSYLPSFDDDSFSVNCGGGDEEPGGVVYFLLPAAAEPAHLTLTTPELLPDFWRLPVP